MSNTRHAAKGSPGSQERYMSSPEYAELRGIGGNAVTAKAALMDHPAKRSLLFFLQAMSLKDGGVKKLCTDFLSAFEDRIGTPTMHLAKGKTGALPNDVASRIMAELDPEDAERCRRDEILRRTGESARRIRAFSDGKISESELDAPYAVKPPATIHTEGRTLKYFLGLCLEQSESLADFIIELCINPALDFSAPGETPKPGASGLPWFNDVVGALYEFRRLYDDKVLQAMAETEASRQVFNTLEVALQTGKMVLIEGNSGIGKTTATEAWCNFHLGEARFVSISGVTHKTGVFRAIAKSLGLASSYARTATEMQARIEDVLQRSRLLLVIDEAHFLFSGAERVYSRPELVDWVDTSLYNQGVPTALVCTPQFRLRLDRAEKQTGWNADQLRRRVKRLVTLPLAPRTEDLKAVARKLLPGAATEIINLVVGYALSSKRNFPALTDVVDEARLISKRAGRDEITKNDCNQAIEEFCDPTAAAWNSAKYLPGCRRDLSAQVPEAAEPICPLPEETPGKPGRKTASKGVRPFDISPLGSRAAPLVQFDRSDMAES